MSSMSTKVFKTAVVCFTVLLGLHLKTYVAKADAVASTQQGVVLKTATLSTNRTITVPVRVQPTPVNTNNNGSARNNISRGQTGGAPVASGSGSKIVNKAMEFLGRPYVYGANGPRAFDCSGFTKYVYASFGINIPRTSQQQNRFGMAVSRSNLAPGDLVIFNTVGYAGHVGIYIGGGQFIHASSGGRKAVIISDLNSSYYKPRFEGGRRIIR
jgi:peptidoglycan DL-endopeptidase CwlO